MSTLSYKIASIIKQADPDNTHSVEVMQYSLNIILNTSFISLISVMIGMLTGRLEESILFLITFALIRFCSGGFHMRSAMACNFVSILLCLVISNVPTLTKDVFWIINVLNIVFMVLFAPHPDKNAQLQKKWYPLMKLLSILFVSSNLIINSSVMALAFFAQSLTVIPWKRRGE